jgi:hypothetical protein
MKDPKYQKAARMIQCLVRRRKARAIVNAARKARAKLVFEAAVSI